MQAGNDELKALGVSNNRISRRELAGRLHCAQSTVVKRLKLLENLLVLEFGFHMNLQLKIDGNG